MLCLNVTPAESMTLLGSVERTELQDLLDWWLSAERRLLSQSHGLQGQSVASVEVLASVDEDTGDETGIKVYECRAGNILLSPESYLWTMLSNIPFLQ